MCIVLCNPTLQSGGAVKRLKTGFSPDCVKLVFCHRKFMQISNRRILLSILLLFPTAVFLSCSTTEKYDESNYQFLFTPPDGVKVADNFFCDRTEISNQDWREYMHWMARIFGAQSEQYLSTLPDTLKWMESYYCMEAYVELYLRHPAYNHFPVVGVSRKQALDFSMWRSDRVFEALLIKLKKIEYDSIQDKNNYFTIERYFNGTFKKTLPGNKVRYYPDFRLPTLTERQQILHYADSLDKVYFDNCNSKYCRECKSEFPKFYAGINPCPYDFTQNSPTIEIYKNYSSKKGEPIYNLRGNVSEWTAENGVSAGGGWYDKRERILQTDTFHIANQNAWTGFRNVCEWKLWGK